MSDQDNQDLFVEQSQNQPPVQETPSAEDAFKELLTSITNERGEQKYKTVEDALKALPHANAFIEQLKTEKQELQTELQKRAAVEDVFEQMKQAQTQPKPAEAPKEDQPSPAPVDLDALIEQKLQIKAAEAEAKANRAAFTEEMTKKFGDKAKDVLATKSAELGLGVEFFRELAAKSPQAALEFFKGQKDPAVDKTKGSVMTTQFNKQPEPTRVTSVLVGASHRQLMDAWKAAAPKE